MLWCAISVAVLNVLVKFLRYLGINLALKGAENRVTSNGVKNSQHKEDNVKRI